MGNLHLVTGYAGRTHVTAADMGSLFEALIRSGQFVMAAGANFEATVVTNNSIRVKDGELLMQGRHVKLDPGAYVDLAIENGEQGLLRHDLIVARYTKNAENGVEECSLVVIKGAAVEGGPVDPEYTTGDINAAGDILHDFPLYRVPISGLNVGNMEPLFTPQASLFEALFPKAGGTLTGNLILTGGKKIQLSNASGHTSAGIGVDSSTGDIYISNINNNWLRIKGDKTMTIGGSKVYTALDKPTPADIGAAASSHNHAAGNITSGTLALARGGTGSSGASTSSASNSHFTAYCAKFGNLVVCSLLPKVSVDTMIYTSEITIPSGYRPSKTWTYSIFTYHNKNNGGSGTISVTVNSAGTLSASHGYGLHVEDACRTYCWTV